MSKIILHCDMNNFFASVECLLDPTLKQKCVAVCGNKEERKGIVLAKNENAKKFGVTTGEPIWQARKKCPALVTVSPHYEYYTLFSQRAKEIYSRFTDLVEPFGIDECWLDVTASTRLFGSGEEIANKIRNAVRSELGLTVSVGVSFNKVFAKLGSDLKKPDATTVISEQNFKNKIYSLDIDQLLGVGKSAKASLNRIGVFTIGDLASISLQTAVSRLGKHGQMLWQYANGLDNSPVSKIDSVTVAKSVSHGTTAPYDLETNDQIKRYIISLSIPISRQLRASNLAATGVQICIKDNALSSREFQCPLDFATNTSSQIAEQAFKLFLKRYDWHSAVRSVTVRAINLVHYEGNVQLDMFHDTEFYEKNERINKTVDALASKFGDDSVVPMVLLEKDK